ncbi:MAG: hypothetical protein ABIA74_02645 [bacterium]
MKILLNDLKKIFKCILTSAEKNGFSEIDINEDYYLTVLKPYELYDKEIKTGIGSFCDDWEWLKKILNDENPVTILDFERLGNIIKVIGDEISKSKNPFLLDAKFDKKKN